MYHQDKLKKHLQKESKNKNKNKKPRKKSEETQVNYSSLRLKKGKRRSEFTRKTP